MKLTKLFILFAISCLGPVCLHAQINEVAEIMPKVEKAVVQTVVREVATQGVIPQGTLSVAALSQQANEVLTQRLSALFANPTIPFVPSVREMPTVSSLPLTFRVQRGENSTGTASAFAIRTPDGRLIGITAAHVMNNIESDPYLLIQTAPGVVKSIRIAAWRKGKDFNVDVAAFEIPQEAAPYVQPLPVAKQPLQANQAVSIAGFTHNIPLWFPQEEVLFVGSQRALVRSSSEELNVGMCGSPIIADGKVVGVYTGFIDEGKKQNPSAWTHVLAGISNKPLPPLHQIVLIDQITPFVESLMNNTAEPAGTVLRVLGRPVTILGQEDTLIEIDLVREGMPVQSVYVGPLADPQHLENFLEIQDNDVVSVSISRGDGSFNIYDINVSTGEVTNPF